MTLGRATVEFPQIFRSSGWVEHDAEEIWKSVEASVTRAIAAAKIDAKDIAGIGITNQRETTLVWDRKTGAPIHNAIVWQCRRTAKTCDELKRAGHAAKILERTGLVIDAVFFGNQSRVAFGQCQWRARARAEKGGSFAFGTIDSFLVHRLTAGAAHVTDVTNASRTLLFGLASLAWDDEMLALFKVPREVLPHVVSSSEVVGETRGLSFLRDGIPIAGIAGDQQAALFGQACFKTGEAKCTYGTGAFALMNIGTKPLWSKSGLLTTVAWKVGNETTYALEGSSFIAGAAVQWLRDGLGLIKSASEIEKLAQEVDSGAAASRHRSGARRAWARRIGIKMRAARSSASRAEPRARTSRVRRSKASRFRFSICSMRCRKTHWFRSRIFASTAAPQKMIC